jgi:hypothetical protein
MNSLSGKIQRDYLLEGCSCATPEYYVSQFTKRHRSDPDYTPRSGYAKSWNRMP